MEKSEKLKQLLDYIGINEDNMAYFINSYVEKVSVDRENNIFIFYIRVSDIPKKNVYDDVLSSLSSSFSAKIDLYFLYDGDNYQNITSYLYPIIDSYIMNSMRYSVFKDREVTTNKNKLIFPVYNKLEEMNISNKEKDILKTLKKYGFSNLEMEIKLEKKEDEDILKKIEADRQVEIPKYVEKKNVVTETPNKDNKNYYRPKKSHEVTKIKDLIYEADNINVEAQLFGIDVFETKSGFKIFTLKITDYSDSMYCKIFTKDDEETARLKSTLKEGNWYLMYGRVKEDNYLGGELVFMTRFNDITPIDAKLDWVRTDNSEEKRCELHAHTMMSQMDGVIDEVRLVKQAIKWGHRGIAITDHDGCQAFPHVFNEVTSYNKKVLAPYKDKIKELEAKKKDIDKDSVCDIKLIDEEILKTREEMK